ncbi:hypothetical protein D3C71_1917950 [compost metagenome]
MRAYCDQREKFIDFVIARILEISATETLEIDSASDHGWNRIVRLVLCANPMPTLSKFTQRPHY